MDVRRHSKKLSWLLRHGAAEEGVAMDPAGWVAIDAVLEALAIDRATLDRVVAENDKQRLQLDGERVRASQGHSRALPVTLDALEASWRRYEGAGPVWHGTNLEAAEAIAQTGAIEPGERTHVHLAASLESHVGKRANVHVMLAVDPTRLADAGQGLFVSPNGVVLARRVPTSAIVERRPMTKRARAALASKR